jgi:hypothetical protein
MRHELRCRILSAIGAGGIGEVYTARVSPLTPKTISDTILGPVAARD